MWSQFPGHLEPGLYTVSLRVTSKECEEVRVGTKVEGTGSNYGLMLCQAHDIGCLA